MDRYDASAIEKHWQDEWHKAGCFTAKRDASKPKYYVLEMFPSRSASGCPSACQKVGAIPASAASS